MGKKTISSNLGKTKGDTTVNYKAQKVFLIYNPKITIICEAQAIEKLELIF